MARLYNRGMGPLYLGLISGTSADGIDAALVELDDDNHRHCQLLHGITFAWEPSLRARLVALGQGGECSGLDELGQLDAQVAIAFADAATALLQAAGIAPSQVRAIGSHGQTVRHRPRAEIPFTMQIGDGNRIAERTGITTVCDLRRRDVAAGGHGAPLLPALHAALLGSTVESRAVLNLGGIANLTLLDAAGGAVRGFDTGPANALLDAWHERHIGTAYDAGGAWAAVGKVDEALLQRMLDEPWFAQPPQTSKRWVPGCPRTRASVTLAAVSSSSVACTSTAASPPRRRAPSQSRWNCSRPLLLGGGCANHGSSSMRWSRASSTLPTAAHAPPAS